LTCIGNAVFLTGTLAGFGHNTVVFQE
jgi:hypothetical protein